MTGSKLDFNGLSQGAVANGIGDYMPLTDLTTGVDATFIQNLGKINGLLPKGKTFVKETRLIKGLFDWIPITANPYGAYSEIAQFVTMPANKKRSGRCMPDGNAELFASYWAMNLGYDVSLRFPEQKYNQVVLDAQTIQQLVAAEMRTALNTQTQLVNVAYKRLISDIGAGTRAINTTTNSDGTGDAVTKTINVPGYLGKQYESAQDVPEVVPGTKLVIGTPEETQAFAVEIYEELLNATSYMKYPSNMYAKGLQGAGAPGNAFTLSGAQNLIMTDALLNTLDVAWTYVKDYPVSARSFREAISTLPNVTLREIDKFDAPVGYTGTIQALLLDSQAIGGYENAMGWRSQYCLDLRSEIWNNQGTYGLGIHTDLPSYGIVAPLPA